MSHCRRFALSTFSMPWIVKLFVLLVVFCVFCVITQTNMEFTQAKLSSVALSQIFYQYKGHLAELISPERTSTTNTTVEEVNAHDLNHGHAAGYRQQLKVKSYMQKVSVTQDDQQGVRQNFMEIANRADSLEGKHRIPYYLKDNYTQDENKMMKQNEQPILINDTYSYKLKGKDQINEQEQQKVHAKEETLSEVRENSGRATNGKESETKSDYSTTDHGDQSIVLAKQQHEERLKKLVQKREEEMMERLTRLRKEGKLIRHLPAMLDTKPPNLLDNYHNPCWTSNSTGELLCAPYIYIIGFPKCGTTDLHAALLKHPMVVGARTKEPHWWARVRFNVRGPEIDIQRYAASYFHQATQEIQDFVEGGFHPKVTVDGSACTSWDNHHWQDLPENAGADLEPRVTTANLIHHFTPSARIIAMLRNPTDRAFSDYKYLRPMTEISVEDFHQGVMSGIATWNSCLQNNTRRACAFNFTVAWQQKLHGKLQIGMYDIFLQDWINVFSQEQVHVVRLEDYSKDRSKELQKIASFLRIGAFPEDVTSWINKMKAQKTNKRSIGSMLPETRKALSQHYAASASGLAQLLGDDRFIW